MKKTIKREVLQNLSVMPENKMLIECTSCGNPDFGQYAPLSPKGYFVVSSFEEASAIARAYIQRWNLGGGNWNGGDIFNKNGEQIARISYNGRVWNSATPKEEEIIIDNNVFTSFLKHYLLVA